MEKQAKPNKKEIFGGVAVLPQATTFGYQSLHSLLPEPSKSNQETEDLQPKKPKKRCCWPCH